MSFDRSIFFICDKESRIIISIKGVIYLLTLNFALRDKYKPKHDDIAPSVQIPHIESNKMTENYFFCLNQVKHCRMAPQNVEMNHVN